MQIFKVIIVGSLLVTSFLDSVLGVEVEATKVRQIELLGAHGLGLVTTSSGCAADHELKIRDTIAVSGASVGLLGGIKEAAMAIPGHHEDLDAESFITSGASDTAQTVALLGACGTFGTLTTSASSSGSYIYPEATTIKTCPSLSCYNGVVSQPSEATYVPATIELPRTTVRIPATTNALEVPGSSIVTTSRVVSATYNMILDASSTSTNGTPTNYGPTAPPTDFSPVTGTASIMEINLLFLGGCLMVFL